MKQRQEVIDYCLTFPCVYEDYPFDDTNWTLMRHKSNKKSFACIFERNGCIWINVKGKPEWCDFWRDAFESVVPAYHMNKTHWNSIILDGSIPDENIKSMIAESYEIIRPKRLNKKEFNEMPPKV